MASESEREAGSGLPRWAEGRQAGEGCGWGEGGPRGGPPAWVWNLGPGDQALEAWVQDPAGLPAWVPKWALPPLRASVSSLDRAVGGGGQRCYVTLNFPS